MPLVPCRPAVGLTTSTPPLREVNFGIYSLQRPTTSPTRRSGRSPSSCQLQPLHGDIIPTNTGAGKSVKRLRAAPFPGTAPSSSSYSISFSPSSAECPASTCGGVAGEPSLPRHGGAVPPPGTEYADGSAPGGSAAAFLRDSGRLTGHAPPSCARGAFSSLSFVEERVRYLVHPVGAASLLPAPLQDILVNVLRILQQERAQLKGQRPCRRPSQPIGTGADAEVGKCMAKAAQAPSLMAAAEIFSAFVTAHPLVGHELLSSPVVLVGAALAELVMLNHIESCAVLAPQLLSFLDAAIAVGHLGAMHTVAVCLRDGAAGLQRDAASSETWLHCAAAAGYLPAMHELGERYERGAPSPSKVKADAQDDSSDWGEAMQWYRRAAEAGYPPSQLNLGKLLFMAAEYAESEHTASSSQVAHLLAEANRWLHACAAAGVEEAVRLRKRIEKQVAR
ncbi:hypothetical protein LSCM1_07373 [Leishmania martiniquensis]|uniref:Sel1 repeat family protein n=1 Tax=Leishmania martiniquensis TaxID=1580590 RepID=A0A836I0J5_9TRYP|nr:hypothetical protein LSCM1_07373 [Leishmania martiniquensis]